MQELAPLAEFEREFIRERTKAGLDAAKARCGTPTDYFVILKSLLD